MDKQNFIDKKYKTFLNIGILIVLIILLLLSFFQKPVEEVIYKDELDVEYQGFVINKYIDCSDHSICKLVLKSGKIINVWDNCYQKVEIGDSVVKDKGNFDFVIYKLSGVEIVDIEDNLIIPNDKK